LTIYINLPRVYVYGVQGKKQKKEIKDEKKKKREREREERVRGVKFGGAMKVNS
jgi:hypothetical protein